jgi:hypothetical protein
LFDIGKLSTILKDILVQSLHGSLERVYHYFGGAGGSALTRCGFGSDPDVQNGKI